LPAGEAAHLPYGVGVKILSAISAFFNHGCPHRIKHGYRGYQLDICDKITKFSMLGMALKVYYFGYRWGVYPHTKTAVKIEFFKGMYSE
jgi:hypothetical protein